MKNILFYGFNKIQCDQIKKYEGKVWDSHIIADNEISYSKSSLETWRTSKFAEEVKKSNISISNVNSIIEEFSSGVLLSCVNLEQRTDNVNVTDCILALKLRTRILLSILENYSIDLIIIRSSPQTSNSLLLSEIGKIKKISFYYFDDVTPTNSVHLCKFDDNKEIIAKGNKKNMSIIDFENFQLEDHVFKSLVKLRKRVATENIFLLFLKTNQFILKALFQLIRRSFSYFLKSFKALVRRREFFLLTTGNYKKKEIGFKFFYLLGMSELKLIFIVIWYEYTALKDWIFRDKNLDNESILFLSSYQPERTTCPDSFGFNDPRLCVIESSSDKQIYYKEHPTIFLRHEQILYRSGKWRSISFYKDLKNLASQKVIFCPTFLNTQYVANLANEVHTIASSFVPENRGFFSSQSSIKPVRFRCYTKNWYTKLENVSSYDKKGINLEKGNSTFKQIQKEYLEGIHSKPNLEIKQKVLFMPDLIDLIAKNISDL